MRRLRGLLPCRLVAIAGLVAFAACGATRVAPPPASASAPHGDVADHASAAASRGSLLLVGGGLDDDASPVYQRLLALAARAGEARVVVMTAATGPQDEEATDKTEALRTWAPTVAVEVVRRETPTDATVAAIDRASALLFTGGNQERITARYRPNDADTPEWLAMRRLLDRGGVIAGCSAGCAMMGQRMLVGGRSAQALGIPRAQAAGANGATGAPSTTTAAGAADHAAGAGAGSAAAAAAEPAPLGPQLGPGMKFLPSGLTDSHFFERDRTGRLAAALRASGERFGLAVGEDAAVAIDLATGDVTGVTPSESLFVDAAHAAPSPNGIVGLRARLISQGDIVSLRAPLPTTPPPAVGQTIARRVPIAEPGQNRQLAMWRVFRQAAVPGAGVHALQLDGWRVRVEADVDGWVAFVVERAN
ncbi:MAG: hypothetical protein FJ301_14535 [Planctomycetes bacterium]|nr:hypothetical protein [Planctomycetota bacterium]